MIWSFHIRKLGLRAKDRKLIRMRGDMLLPRLHCWPPFDSSALPLDTLTMTVDVVYETRTPLWLDCDPGT